MSQQLNYLKCLEILRRRKEKRRKIKELESAKNEANKQGKKVIQKKVSWQTWLFTVGRKKNIQVWQGVVVGVYMNFVALN